MTSKYIGTKKDFINKLHEAKLKSRSYKVQITKTYVIDVTSINEDFAKQGAQNILDIKMREGIEHYNESGDPDFVVFDVTNTDDDFNLNS